VPGWVWPVGLAVVAVLTGVGIIVRRVRGNRNGAGLRAYKSHYDEPISFPMAYGPPMVGGRTAPGVGSVCVQSPLQPAMMELSSQPIHSGLQLESDQADYTDVSVAPLVAADSAATDHRHV